MEPNRVTPLVDLESINERIEAEKPRCFGHEHNGTHTACNCEAMWECGCGTCLCRAHYADMQSRRVPYCGCTWRRIEHPSHLADRIGLMQEVWRLRALLAVAQIQSDALPIIESSARDAAAECAALRAECETLRADARVAAQREAVQTSVANDGWQEVERQRDVIAAHESRAVQADVARQRIADALYLDTESSWDGLVPSIEKVCRESFEVEAFRGRLAELLDAGEAPALAMLTALTNAAVTERAMLRAAIAGRSAPTAAEIAKHEAAGGLWRCVVTGSRSLSLDMLRGRAVPHCVSVLDALGETATWWALDATGKLIVGAPNVAADASKEGA